MVALTNRVNKENVLKSFIGRNYILFCEYFNISGGWPTPYMFGWMIGSKAKKLENK